MNMLSGFIKLICIVILSNNMHSDSIKCIFIVFLLKLMNILCGSIKCLCIVALLNLVCIWVILSLHA